VAGLLRISREKTGPIYFGIRLERRREDSQAQSNGFGIQDYGEGIPRLDPSDRRSALLNRPRASANRIPALYLILTQYGSALQHENCEPFVVAMRNEPFGYAKYFATKKLFAPFGSADPCLSP
jgi:hypothetical protein